MTILPRHIFDLTKTQIAPEASSCSQQLNLFNKPLKLEQFKKSDDSKQQHTRKFKYAFSAKTH
jgi:hypothetical protein